MLIPGVVALIAIGSAVSGERLQSCYSCSTRTASSRCHLRPVRKPEMAVRCGERTALCVTERLQAEDGAMLAIQRRCSSREETKQAHNRCERTPSGLRCLTFCYGAFCNSGTGQLFTGARRPWDYDDPEYADYVYDPEEAVLGNRKRPYSGPFPVGTGEFPVGTGEFPVGTGKFPVGTKEFPVGTGEFPVGTEEFPVGKGEFPVARTVALVEVESGAGVMVPQGLLEMMVVVVALVMPVMWRRVAW